MSFLSFVLLILSPLLLVRWVNEQLGGCFVGGQDEPSTPPYVFCTLYTKDLSAV